MTASSASSKAKAKFSSRNLSAVYKAPVLRGVELSANGVGSSGVNRMLVLKAPLRGTTKANAVAAPTPINTPSLRKENNGQDVNVCLVPAGKSGGWGLGSDGSVERDDANARQPETLPTQAAAHTQRVTHQSRGVTANAWSGPVAPLSRTSSSSSGGGTAVVMPMGVDRASSGRWGDDAVEEDLAKADMYRQMERKREFPELLDHQRANEHEQMRFHEHSRSQQHPGYSQDARAQHPHAAYHSEAQYLDHRRGFEFGPPPEVGSARHHGYDERGAAYREAVYHQRPPQHFMDERGYRGSYHSNQDARYDSFSRGDPRAEYSRDYGGPHNHDDRGFHHQHSYQPRTSARGPDECYQAGQAHGGYGPRYYREYSSRPAEENNHVPRGDFQETSTSSQQARIDADVDEDNQVDHSEPDVRSSRPNSATTWRTSSPNPRPSSAAANVWKMSESEVGSSKQVPEFHRTVGSVQLSQRPVARPSYQEVQPPASVPLTSQVRILKRNGPRMLFDPKSGKMVEVEDPVSSRRSHTSSPAPRDAPHVRSESTSESSGSVVVGAKEDVGRHDRTSIEAVQGNVSVVAESPPSSESIEEVSHGAKEPSLRGRKTRTRSKPSEVRSKRVAIGGKMKKVHVAYRPVVQPSEQHAVNDTHQNLAGAASPKAGSSQVKQAQSPMKLTVREARVKASEKISKASKRSDETAKTKLARPNFTENVTKETTRAARIATTKATRSLPKRVVEHRHAKRITAIPVKSTAVTRFDELKAFFPGDGVVFVDEDLSAQDQFEDEDATFTTVKSRRAVLLERKRQREQLAAALSGFHERGGTKRTSTRVVLPASLQRFGKKGVLVGFRVTAKEDSATSAAAPPPLVKPFIDVIRPPGSATENQKKSETPDPQSGATTTKTLKNDKQRTRKSRAPTIADMKSKAEKPTQVEREACVVASKNTAEETKTITPPVEVDAPASMSEVVGSSPRDDVKPQPVIERLESGLQRERPRSVMKKGAKRVYVAKQPAVVVDGTKESSQSPPPVPKPLAANPRSSIDGPAESVVKEKVKQISVPVKETAEVKPHRQTRSKRRNSSVSSWDENIRAIEKEEFAEVKATPEEKKQKSPKVKPVAKAKTKDSPPRAVEPTKKDVAKTEVIKTDFIKADDVKEGLTKAKKKAKIPKAELAKVDVAKVEMANNNKVKVAEAKMDVATALPSSTATRRPSKAKSLGVPKTTTSSSTQKVYKKVYVVKAASTAAMSSPSAA